MDIRIRGKGIDVNPALKQYAEKKLAKLEKYIRQSDLTCQMVFSKQKTRYVVEVTMPLNNYLLRAEESAQDSFASIDLVLEKIERQIEKYKTKLMKRDKTGVQVQEKDEQENVKIVKVKRFNIKPMALEEAAMQMELLGHDFFVFANGETGNVNVLYRRKDGNFGLIEPED